MRLQSESTLSWLFTPLVSLLSSLPSLLFHLIKVPSTSWYPPLVQFLLQPRYFLQTLGIPDERFNSLPLLVCKLDSIGFVPCTGATIGKRRGGDVEGAGFYAHNLWRMERISKDYESEKYDIDWVEMPSAYLRRKCGRFLSSAEEFRGFGSLNVFYFLVVKEADGRATPYNPVSIILARILDQPPSRRQKSASGGSSHFFSRDRVLQ